VLGDLLPYLLSSLFFHLDKSGGWHFDLGEGMLRIGLCQHQEVFRVNKLASSLENSEFTVNTRLLYAPEKFIFNSLKIRLQKTFS